MILCDSLSDMNVLLTLVLSQINLLTYLLANVRVDKPVLAH